MQEFILKKATVKSPTTAKNKRKLSSRELLCIGAECIYFINCNLEKAEKDNKKTDLNKQNKMNKELVII